MEALLSTDTSGQLWTASLVDPFTGSSLATFKSGYSCHRSLCSTKERLIIASKDRPILSVWDFRGSRKDGQPQRQMCPGIVSALATSADHHYIAAGIAEKVHIWQLTDGMLVAVLTTHYQTVTKVCFTDDGSHIVTASKDNMILIWEMSEVVHQCTLGKSCSPLHVVSGHTLPVTDLFVGAGGPMAHIISASQDHSCKVWELCSGQQLCNLLFDVPVECVTADGAETCMFAGCSDGAIYLVHLFDEGSSQERHISKSDQSAVNVFQGHSSSVTCLSVSLDGSMLASGSTDNTARIWDIGSGQCIRVIQHKASVGAVQFVLRPVVPPTNAPPPKALPPLSPFQRNFSWSGAGDATVHGSFEGGCAVKISRPVEDTDEKYEEEVGLPRNVQDANAQIFKFQKQPRSDEDEVTRLRRINAQLYHLCANSLLDRTESASSGNER
ncbi:WD repeat-containing protein 18-like [Lytechinus variegatus]|uniref:WD repeat-containing protein 18-like n=1 Tax=Lytechinus variegatus TaxID=7654 RepID=UPI001BB22CB1|nr:WD repeat-containing protein 18-like [Lytechinus variegatus]